MNDTAPSDLFALPKAELHLHIEGTLEPDLAFELARRNGLGLPYASVAELEALYDFENLQSFLDLYYATMAVLRTEEDFADLTRAYLVRAAAQGVRHVELFFDPQAHTVRGVPLEAVIDGIATALDEAERERDITSAMIMCFLRDQPVESARETLEAALAIRPGRIAGVGLDSAEVGYPPSLFAEVYDLAARAGLRRVAHAGEEGPPSYIREALDLLGAERIDHGIRLVEDDELLARVVRERIPLTVCPLSNLRLRAVDTLAEHTLLVLLEAGALVTVNSDDPAYFGGYVGDNFVAIRDALGVTRAQSERLARNSVEASFVSGARKAQLAGEIDRWAAQNAQDAQTSAPNVNNM